MGYHKREIQKGVFGEFSKVQEEFEELKDGYDQKNKILQIVELTDLLGAIEAYGNKLGVSMTDMLSMMEATKKAFKDGDRQ